MPSIQEVSAQQLSRRDEGDSRGMKPVYIAGIVVVGVAMLILVIWFSIRFARKRAAKKRAHNRESAFLSVRGVVKEGGALKSNEKFERPNLRVQTDRNAFSRNQLHAGIMMPERTLAPRTRDEIINYHRQSGNFPKPFAFASGGPSSPDPGLLTAPDRLSAVPRSPESPSAPMGSDSRAVSWVRHSFMSAFSTNRYSVASSMAASSFAEPTTGTSRKIRQLFTPVLPDELLLTQLGEHLTVIQSFDDGWCIVGRENASSFLQKKSLFGSKNDSAPDPNVELGVVPAWCFMKPVKGLRAERPVRSTSLGVTVQIDAPSESRDQMISWSNF